MARPTTNTAPTAKARNIGRIESDFGVGGQWGVHLGFSAKDYGDIEDDAVGRMKNTGYPEQDLDFRFDMALTEPRQCSRSPISM